MGGGEVASGQWAGVRSLVDSGWGEVTSGQWAGLRLLVDSGRS